jgi:hypothetical protein
MSPQEGAGAGRGWGPPLLSHHHLPHVLAIKYPRMGPLLHIVTAKKFYKTWRRYLYATMYSKRGRC